MKVFSNMLWLFCLPVIGLGSGCVTASNPAPGQTPATVQTPPPPPAPVLIPTPVASTNNATPPPRLEDRQKLRDLFAAADTDGNGSISLDEFKTFQSRRESRAKEKRGDQAAADRPAKQHSPEDMFARLDTDKNGVLSRAELEAGRDRAQQRQKGDRPERPAEKRIRPGQ